MQSTKLQRLPLAPPRKTPERKSASSSPHRTISPVKRPTRKKTNNLSPRHSDTGLVSSFRKLSISSSPHPPSRSNSTSPRKLKSNYVRKISTAAVNSVEDLVNLIKGDKCKNIIVMAGAGISTPSGIPDFR